MNRASAVIAGWAADWRHRPTPRSATAPCRPRRAPEAATGTGAAPPRKLRADARCYRRADANSHRGLPVGPG